MSKCVKRDYKKIQPIQMSSDHCGVGWLRVESEIMSKSSKSPCTESSGNCPEGRRAAVLWTDAWALEAYWGECIYIKGSEAIEKQLKSEMIPIFEAKQESVSAVQVPSDCLTSVPGYPLDSWFLFMWPLGDSSSGTCGWVPATCLGDLC